MAPTPSRHSSASSCRCCARCSFTILIFRTIDTLKVFDIIFGTTGGGPQISTEVMQTMAYRKAFSFLQMSESMTVMVIFSAIVLAICLVYLRLEERLEDA